MLEVPRSVVLAAWAGAVAAGRATPAAALAAVTGSDEPHTTQRRSASAGAPGHPTAGPPWNGPARPGTASTTSSTGGRLAALAGGGLLDLVEGLAGTGARVRAVLPAPGDPAGLAGPPGLTADAVDAGEAVIVDDPGAGGRFVADDAATATALVPEVSEFGSVLEPGAMVTWTVQPARVRADVDALDLDGAARTLRAALSRSSAELAGLDLARWREEAADRLADARGGALARDAFPPSAPPAAVATATTAARVLLIVELASADDGGAVVAGEASARREVLRGVDAVARAALAVAASSTWRAQSPSAAS